MIIEDLYPNFLMNHREHGAYFLTDAPVYPEGSRVRLARFPDLLTASPPSLPTIEGRQIVVCEAGNCWPVSMDLHPDMEDRQMQFKSAAEHGNQAATQEAIADQGKEQLMAMWSIACLAIFAVCAVIIVALVLTSDVGSGLLDSLPGA